MLLMDLIAFQSTRTFEWPQKNIGGVVVVESSCFLCDFLRFGRCYNSRSGSDVRDFLSPTEDRRKPHGNVSLSGHPEILNRRN